MFGLKEAEVAHLVRAVCQGEGELDRAAIEERFARATWTGIAEPGDRIAGQAIAALGPARALTAVLENWAPGKLVSEVGGASGAFATSPLGLEDAQKALDRWKPRPSATVALIALRQAARYGVKLRTPRDDDWPEGVDDLGDCAPIALWTRGPDAAYRSLSSSIALVGARAATGYGEHVTMEASAGLVDRGYTIVSGAAYGIDGMAHRAALASKGLTVAFLAGGVDRFYPSGHDALLERIVATGAVISELPCGSPPTKWRFLQRNRLIAASSLATVVLEAGWRSGSLNTARHANDLVRPLGAVPGPVTSAASAGCHKALREMNAICVTNADEMAELAPLGGMIVRDEPVSCSDSAEVTRIRDAMSTRAARPAGEIAARAGMSVADTQAVLGTLELEGRARDTGTGWLKS